MTKHTKSTDIVKVKYIDSGIIELNGKRYKLLDPQPDEKGDK